METQKGLIGFFAAIVLFTVNPLFAQGPPNNDEFAHRTPLTGSSITFTGTLVGATMEPAETNASFVWPWPGGRSVWWTWTAAESTAVVIAIQPESWPNITNAVAFVYSGTNLDTLTFLAEHQFTKPPCRYFRFDATAGTSYQIRVAAASGGGGVGGPFTLSLTATNPPVFVAQPQNCTVSPYGTAFFSSIASGPTPRTIMWPRPPRTTTTYQWFFNGVPIQGETYPCLLLHRVTTNQAGTYSVIASNIGGVTLSDAATLTVTDTNPVPRLVVLPPNNSSLRFNLTGEPGRWYRVESSTNLQDWINPTFLQLTNPSTLVSVPRLTPNHFVRASLDVHTDVCVAQLKQMWWAANLFSIDNQKSATDTYGLTDLQPYIPLTSSGTLPWCPEGVYASGGTLRDPPTCSLYSHGHVITDTP